MVVRGTEKDSGRILDEPKLEIVAFCVLGYMYDGL